MYFQSSRFCLRFQGTPACGRESKVRKVYKVYKVDKKARVYKVHKEGESPPQNTSLQGA